MTYYDYDHCILKLLSCLRTLMCYNVKNRRRDYVDFHSTTRENYYPRIELYIPLLAWRNLKSFLERIQMMLFFSTSTFSPYVMPERICYKDFTFLVDIPVLYLFFTSMWTLQIHAHFIFFLNLNFRPSLTTLSFRLPL